MSISIMSAVWTRSAQASGNLLVLLALADFADDDGFCYPSVRTIAAKARITERHARRVIRELEDAGEVQVAESAGRGGSNRYRVTPPEKLVSEFACTLCLTCFPSSEWLDDHHKHPTALGGKDVPENRQTLCRPCHRKMHVSGSETLTRLGEVLRDEGIEVARTFASPDKMSGGDKSESPLTSASGLRTPASANPDMGVSRSVIDPSLNSSDSDDPVFSHEIQAAAASTVSAEQIYEAYPLKVGRAAAIAKIRIALKKKPAAFLLERTQLFAAAVAKWNEVDREYVPHARTWFNQGRYDDDPRTWERKATRKFQGKTGGTFEPSQYDESPFGEQRRDTA